MTKVETPKDPVIKAIPEPTLRRLRFTINI